jgi:hypothetical protein
MQSSPSLILKFFLQSRSYYRNFPCYSLAWLSNTVKTCYELECINILIKLTGWSRFRFNLFNHHFLPSLITKFIIHSVTHLMAQRILKEHDSKTELHQANPATVPSNRPRPIQCNSYLRNTDPSDTVSLQGRYEIIFNWTMETCLQNFQSNPTWRKNADRKT